MHNISLVSYIIAVQFDSIVGTKYGHKIALQFPRFKVNSFFARMEC